MAHLSKQTYSQLLFRVLLHESANSDVHVLDLSGQCFGWIWKQKVFPVFRRFADDLESPLHVSKREAAERKPDVELHALGPPETFNYLLFK